MPEEEIALVLLEALHGDSALLCQDIPLARLYTADGVNYLLSHLAPMEQQRIHGYHQAMRNYENIRRQAGEQVRAYHARFLACEHQLLRLGLTSYQSESRAIKWLT
eukprot:4765824-Amphidinium_carterae.1